MDPVVDIEATDDQPSTAVALRRPDVPTTLNEIAALKGEAVEIIEARVQVLETLRKAAIRATHPEDWLLFKSPEEGGGQVVGVLQDCGCDRVRDLYGVEIFQVGKPEKILTNDPAVFHYLQSASGRCKLTRQVVEQMEGGRSSTDEFLKDKTGADLELAVRKACRANLDGNITRELAGMKSVPLEELARAWEGTPKKTDRCRLGRGFGSRSERLGATAAGVPDVEPPVCTVCGTKGVYRSGKEGRPGFYGCANYKNHPDRKWIVDADKWVAEQRAKAPPPAAAGESNGTTSGKASTAKPAEKPKRPDPESQTAKPTDRPLVAEDIFGGTGRDREPGEDG